MKTGFLALAASALVIGVAVAADENQQRVMISQHLTIAQQDKKQCVWEDRSYNNGYTCTTPCANECIIIVCSNGEWKPVKPCLRVWGCPPPC
jgi:hypothetical protein